MCMQFSCILDCDICRTSGVEPCFLLRLIRYGHSVAKIYCELSSTEQNDCACITKIAVDAPVELEWSYRYKYLLGHLLFAIIILQKS